MVMDIFYLTQKMSFLHITPVKSKRIVEIPATYNVMTSLKPPQSQTTSVHIYRGWECGAPGGVSKTQMSSSIQELLKF